MDTMLNNKEWHLIRNDNGEWICDEYAVFVTKNQLKMLQTKTAKMGKSLSVQHGPEGSLWCYRHEIDNLQSVTMKKDDIILDKIKAQLGNGIRFPKYISFSIKGNRLFVNIVAKGVTANMQTDSSAFEGWIICLKACLSNEICDVVLSWEIPVFDEDEKDKTLKQHYNRFVFRAMMFETVYSWVSVSSDNRDEINRLIKKLPHVVINYPKSKSKDKVSDNGKVHKGEAILERQLVTVMRESVPITDHQLPVGLFERTVKTKNALTPRGASQIDIWQLDHGILRISWPIPLPAYQWPC